MHCLKSACSPPPYAVGSGTGSINITDQGVLHALEQLKYQFQFIDTGVDLANYAVIILPDAIPVDPELAARLRAYVAAGGKLLITGRSAIDTTGGDFILADLMGVHLVGDAPFAPDYLVLGPELAEGIEPMPHSCELRGVEISAEPGCEVLAWSGAPYFNRTWEHFCSHRTTPFDRAVDSPVVVQQGNVITIARPLFTEYAEFSKRVHKQLIHNCLQRLIPRPRIGAHNLPSTAVVTVRKQDADLIVHLLHYVPQRRGRTLDVIEDVLPLSGVRLQVAAAQRPSSVRRVPEMKDVAWQWRDGYVDIEVSTVNGYQIVQLVGAA